METNTKNQPVKIRMSTLLDAQRYQMVGGQSQTTNLYAEALRALANDPVQEFKTKYRAGRTLDQCERLLKDFGKTRDALIEQHSQNWRLERMPAVDRNLLRMAIGEMIGFKGTPFPIIINEALEIGRRYSAPESINFLNGMLDTIARGMIGK